MADWLADFAEVLVCRRADEAQWEARALEMGGPKARGMSRRGKEEESENGKRKGEGERESERGMITISTNAILPKLDSPLYVSDQSGIWADASRKQETGYLLLSGSRPCLPCCRRRLS